MKKIITSILLLSGVAAFSQVDGTWLMAPQAGAMMVGPGQGLGDWWSSDAQAVTDRACFFDDEFILSSDGTFSNSMGTETWIETWQGAAADGCDTAVAPHDGSNAATWSYDTAGTITLSGVGAHLGIPKAVNGGELTDTNLAVPSSITYFVSFSADSNTMTVDIDIREDTTDPGWWRFILARKGTIDTTGDTSNVGILELDESKFNVYPNPANEMVNIQYEVKSADNRTISILDNMGREVMMVQTGFNSAGMQEKNINVSSLSPGMYFVKLQSSEGVELRELIINNK